MGSSDNTVAVADFGSREVRVLIARQDETGEVALLGAGRADSRGSVNQGMVQDRTAVQQVLKDALRQAEREAKTRPGSLYCGISGRGIDAYTREGRVALEGEPVERKHLDEARDVASRDILTSGRDLLTSVTAQEWYIDDQRVRNPLSCHGQVLKGVFHFARVPSVILDNVGACVNSLGREVDDVVLLPLAAALGCLTGEDTELGVAVIDMGRTTAGLAVYRDGRLLDTRCFPWGSYQITRDVAAGLRISFEEADELVLQYGIALELIEEDFGQENDGAAEEEAGDSEAGGRGESPGLKLRSAVPGAPSIAVRREFDTIVYDRAKELMTMVRQHIKSQDLSRSLIRGVVLTGGASAIQHYDRLAEAVFQTPCRLGRPLPAPGYPSLNDPSLSAAAGLLRHAFEHRAAVREGRLGDSSALPKWMQRLGGVFRRFFL